MRAVHSSQLFCFSLSAGSKHHVSEAEDVNEGLHCCPKVVHGLAVRSLQPHMHQRPMAQTVFLDDMLCSAVLYNL